MNSGHLSPVPSPDDRSQRTQLAESILYQVNSVLPDDQQLVTVEPKTPASEALAVLKLHGYSQLPVVQHGTLLGVFSHRSFADGVLELSGERRLRPEELPVMDFWGSGGDRR
jgi:predicted transcriptional regulator